MSVFMERLQFLMDERGMSDKELREQCGGISKNNITNWRNGTKPQAAAVHKIAEFFNVSADWLLGIDDVKERISSVLTKSAIDEQIEELVRLYRSCDAKGQFKISHIAMLEWERCEEERKKSENGASSEDVG